MKILIDPNTRKFLTLSLMAGTMLGFMPLTAQAQISEATRAADAARTQSTILNREQNIPLAPAYEVKETSTQQAPQGAENIRFTLSSLNLTGVTAYDVSVLENLYRDKIGTEISLADIYALSTQITNKYRNEGYILTQVVVPPQTIEDGKVTLQVVEGFVDQITIEGEEHTNEEAQIRAYAENVKKTAALNARDLERNLLLINDLPGVTARTILSPSRTTVGASDMTIIVERDRHDAELSFDNFGSRYLGAYQGTARADLNSLAFNNNERLSGSIVVAGDNEKLDELSFFAIDYEQPFWSQGTRAQVRASYARTRPGYDLEEFDVQGRSQYLSLGLSHPVIRTRDVNLSVRGFADWRDAASKNNIETKRMDKIRALRGGVNLQFLDTLVGVGVNALDLEVAQGLDILGASDRGDGALTRARGEPQFTKANLTVQRLQRVTEKTNILFAAEGQLSANPLLSSEEFGVGGMNIGRSYDPSEIVGDDGMAGKIELQINNPFAVPHILDYQLYAFLDYGKVWNQDATTSTDKVQSLTSTGLGVRANVTEKTSGGLALALPMTRDVDSRDDTDLRILFNINHKF